MENTIYNSIGDGYNQTRQADVHLAERLLKLLDPKKGECYLDIGCGTGNYTLKLAGQGVKVYGVDPSEKMLDEAAQKSNEIKWIRGSAEQVPLDDNMFSGIIATLTLHHWTSLEKGFAELFRVLKPGGTLVIFSSLPEQMLGYWLNHYFPQMLKSSIDQMPSMEKISSAAEKAGFKIRLTEKYFVRPDLTDHFLYVGKNRPQLYLQENIRKGISSFAALANRDEVEWGLQKLEQDINSGKIAAIQEQYANDLGDYIFISVHKS